MIPVKNGKRRESPGREGSPRPGPDDRAKGRIRDTRPPPVQVSYFRDVPMKLGSFATLAAIRRASSRLSSLAAERRPGPSS